MNAEVRRSAPCLIKTLSPHSAEEVAQLVVRAAEAGQAVYPIGAGTQMDVGCAAGRPGIGLSLAAIDRLIDYQPDDMTITVEAGMRLDQLRRHLAERGQWLPVDFAAPSGSVGGALAVGLCGPRRYGLGGWADYLLGLRAVDGLGNLFFSGAKVVKSAAGLNVHRLLIGSLGALGIIVEATLMVRPRPELQAALACRIREPAQADQLLDHLSRSRLTPISIDVYSGSVWAQLSAAAAPNGPVLVVGFAGAAADVRWMLDELRRQWLDAGVSASAIEPVDQFEPLCESAAAWPAEVVVATRASRLFPAMARLGGVMTELPWMARAGEGLLHLRLGPRTPTVWQSFLQERIAGPLAEDRAARVVVIRPPEGAAAAPSDVWSPARDEAAVWAALKEKFDPRGILNPGRYLDATVPVDRSASASSSATPPTVDFHERVRAST